MMEVLLLIVLIIILVIVLGIKKDTSWRLTNLDAKLEILKEELKKSRERTIVAEKPAGESFLQEQARLHKPGAIQDLPVEKATTIPTASPEIKKEEQRRPDIVIPGAITPPVHTPAAQQKILPKPKTPGFFERNPDIEKFIGENLANKIGIGVLVLGIGFFVKYAIDQEWINEIGRVFIGILCGGILLGVAHKLRRTFVAFSSVLVGGGIAVLYLTIAIAFHEYGIFSQTAAFILMLVITGFAVVLSLAYNRIELAVVSLLGGFASPFMVSTGEGNYVVLFVYILILDMGMLILAYYKKWNLVNIIAYAFTILLFGSWLGTQFDGTNVSMITGAMIFATLFYLVFFAMNIVNNIKERTPFKGIEISILLSNTFFYYGAGIAILANSTGTDFKGLFTAALGVFNFIFAYILYRNKGVDKNLVYMLIGLVLTFISLAAPVQLEGNYITLFWSAETVLVLWLSQKSGIRLMKLASVVLMVLMLISLSMDWINIYTIDDGGSLMIMLNKGYITGLFSIASITATLALLKNENVENKEHIALYRNSLFVLGVLVLYISQLLELRHQLYAYGFDYYTENIIIGVYNMFFIFCLVLAQKKWVRHRTLGFAFIFWGAFVMIAYAAFYHGQTILVRNDFVLKGGPVTGFIFHYFLVAFLICITSVTLRSIQAEKEFNAQTNNAYSWIYVFFFVFLASAELDHLVVVSLGASTENIDRILSQNHKIGYPILWGLTSFLLIFIGLKRKKKHLRIVSLSLFLLTLLKLFIVDIRGISEGGKIAAFISLGVLLLVVSFMYQRLKKLLLAEETSLNSFDPKKPV